ncbi:MAG: peptidoglycan editing factor PgeF [Rhizobiaceae bacterium]|nr:peptidoglycan editing factor PgeF [Rhizobiaceae bacterium]
MLQRIEPEAVAPAPVTSARLALPGISHGWFTRQGGVSSGVHAALNAGPGSNDDPALVAENRARIAASLGVTPSHLLSPFQFHSAEVVTVDAAFAGERPRADAIVTATPGLAVGVLTADCGPVLFADPEARVVGAAHAGWQGAVGGVLENTIATMVALGARHGAIIAVLGPTISQINYEVGADFEGNVTAHDSAAAPFFAPGQSAAKRQFDLPGYILMRLARAGVAACWTGDCTYADEARFFSYRRTTHRGETDYGRQLSAILLE